MLALTSPSAMANAKLEIISGTHSATVTANALGVATFTGNVGSWALTLTSGTTFPTLGSPAVPTLDIASLVGSGTAPLEILFSDDGYTHAGVAALQLHLNVANNLQSVMLALFADANGDLLDTTGTAVATASLAGSGSVAAHGLITRTGPYALTEEILITPVLHKKASIVSLDGTVTVPDGGLTLASLGSLFVVLGGVSRRFRK
jgi:hypothetical protein